jgi:D-glycero-alpha-D-manno-heptose-7-phosphate kinase
MGGGSDYPIFYEKYGGAVLSTAINKYCYVSVRYLPPFFDYNYRIRYSRQEEVKSIAEIEHPSVRECLKFLDIKHGVEIQHNADLPAMAGLGSSSAFTVGLLNALNALQGKMITKRQLALDAIHVEQDLIGEAVGTQDQVCVAWGGFNKIEFGGSKKFMVMPITLSQERLESLQNHLMLFFTGFSRNASEVAKEQIKVTPQKTAEIKAMMAMVDEALNILDGENDLIDFGKLLNEKWKIKRSLTTHISSPAIDDIYETGIKAGAIGGGLIGAGGGGFFLFLVEPEHQQKVRDSLKKLPCVPFKFHSLGSQIVYYAPEEVIADG